MKIEHKTLPVHGVKVIDADNGIVEAYVAGIGNKDSVNDIIEPGAFDDSLRVRKPKGVWAHIWEQPVSKTLETYEVKAGDPRLPAKMLAANAGGQYVRMQFNMKTQRGREAFDDVVFYGEEQEWSIGYAVPEGGSRIEDGVRYLSKIDWFEYSPVLFGANSLTATAGFKSLEAKVVPGSHEDWRARLSKALVEHLGKPAYIAATFDDRCVYFAMEAVGQTYVEQAYSVPFTHNTDDTFTFGEPSPVEVVETIIAARARAALREASRKESDDMDPKAAEDAEKAIEAIELATPLLQSKAGRFISRREEARLRRALAAITDVLGATEDDDDDKEKGAPPPVADGALRIDIAADDLDEATKVLIGLAAIKQAAT